MEERICERDEFKSGVEGRGSDRWWERKVVTVMRWYAQDEVNQEDSEQNDVDGVFNVSAAAAASRDFAAEIPPESSIARYCYRLSVRLSVCPWRWGIVTT